MRGARLRAALVYGGTAALALAAPRVARWACRRVPAPVADAAVLAACVGIGWGTIAYLERRYPFRRDWNRARGDVRTDLADMLVSDSAAQVLAAAVVSPVRTRIGDRYDGGALGRMPLAVRIGVLLLAFDLGHYTLHRVMHEQGSLWRFHAPHHSPSRLYWLNATRFHPAEMAVDAAQEQLMLAAFGVDAPTRLAYQVFRAIYGQIQHANIDLESGPLNAVLSTAERHRWHHSDDPAEGNSNYGAVVAVWDRAFGSSFTPGRDFDAELGNGDAEYPESWAGQLAAPFR